MPTTGRRRRLLPSVAAAVLLWAVPGPPASAGWAPALVAGSTAVAKAAAPVSAPSTLSVPCSSLDQNGELTLTWTAVPHATFSIQMSIDGGAPTTAASGLTAPTWLTPALGNHDYTFGVVASIGQNWVSPSSPTVTVSIWGNGNHCT